MRGLFGGVKPGYRTAPAWVGIVSHPLIVAVSLPLTALAWRRARRGQSDALLLLALLLLLRCVLDTWDTVYYPIPFVLALLAWESLGAATPSGDARAVEHGARVGQLPVAARARLGRRPGGLLPGLDRAAGHGTCLASIRTGAHGRLTRGTLRSARLLPAQETTVSSLDSRVSTS